MPQLIKHIDQIAREKQRDVLFLEFNPKPTKKDIWGDDQGRYWFEQDPIRKQILEHLTTMSILWECCASFANENAIDSYNGRVYIELPINEDCPRYQSLVDYLEYPDGTMRFKNVRFYALSLEIAMQNAHHDAPGFWEKWAENF
jgi:hypothetical protein